jgi:PhoPQ-activated pathogenicity-related protein
VTRITGVFLLLICWLVLLASAAFAAELRAEDMLSAYVNAPDQAYHWEPGPVGAKGDVSTYDIILTSQRWHGTDWQHMLRVFVPKMSSHPGWMGLYVTGDGNPVVPGKAMGEDDMAVAMATMMAAPVAMLYQVPNQPLFNGLDEGAIIDYSFAQYVKTGDPTWPALFPMTKSAVRAMDALQEFMPRDLHTQISSFVVMGGSKRGWATWLTPAADHTGRVKAIVPIVFDALNIKAQVARAEHLLGKGKGAIAAMTGALGTPRGDALWTAIDPYTYREQLTLPKLIMNATDDLFYNTDGLNYYWDGLRGGKWIYYAPNSPHGMTVGRERTLMTMSAFFRTIAEGKEMPAMSWTRDSDGKSATLTITAPEAQAANVWVATRDTLDFRSARWVSQPMERAASVAGAPEAGVWSITVPRPEDRNMTLFGQAEFEVQGLSCFLCTQPMIVEK